MSTRQARIAAVSVAALAAAVAAPPAGGSSTRTVRAVDIEFEPGTVTVRRGDSVRWRFLDGKVPHNVTSRGRRRFRSSDTRFSGTHTVRFRRPGTYRYVCTLHPNMRGKVVVR